MRKVRVFAPATAANLAAGYEIFGMALEAPGDRVCAEILSETGAKPGDNVRILSVRGDAGRLPQEPDKNTAGVAAQALLDQLDFTGLIGLDIEKQMPLCSGMGSSAASAAAAVFAVNELLGKPLSAMALVRFAMAGEQLASGSAHADNVAPSLLGGVVLIRSYEPLDVLSLAIPRDLHYAVVHPDIKVSTAAARERVPKTFTTATTITQMGNAAAFVSALAQSDWALLGRACEDWLAEPVRAELIPGFSLVKEAALRAGACGAGLAGSGPAMFALADSLQTARSCATKMRHIFTRQDIACTAYSGRVLAQGARVV